MPRVDDTVTFSITPTVGGLLLGAGAVIGALAGISDRAGVWVLGVPLLVAGAAVRLEAPIRRGAVTANTIAPRWIGAAAILLGLLCAVVAMSPHERVGPGAIVLVLIGSFLRVESAIGDRSRP